VIGAFLLACTGTAAVSAQTIAYWRFEGDSTAFLSDSSGNGRTLTALNSVEQLALPASGAGSAFFDPVPRTGAANLSAAHKTIYGATTNEASRTFLRAADADAFTSNTVTVEALVNFAQRPTTNTLVFVAGHFTSTGNQRGYAMIVNNQSNLLGVALSADGANATQYFSDFTIANGKDYYFGVSINLTAATAQERSVTFFLQNLTDGGELLSQTVTGISQSALFNAASAFGIGAQGNGNSSENWSGLIDEVRVSNVALSANQLLVAIPEPSSAAALLGLAGLGFAATRRRRTAC
jgi:hypothetical protein